MVNNWAVRWLLYISFFCLGLWALFQAPDNNYIEKLCIVRGTTIYDKEQPKLDPQKDAVILTTKPAGVFLGAKSITLSSGSIKFAGVPVVRIGLFNEISSLKFEYNSQSELGFFTINFNDSIHPMGWISKDCWNLILGIIPEQHLPLEKVIISGL